MLCADGAYASLARRGLPRTTLTSRMRRDAALYEAAPPRTGKPGRPRKKGKRLDAPEEMARRLNVDDVARSLKRTRLRKSTIRAVLSTGARLSHRCTLWPARFDLSAP